MKRWVWTMVAAGLAVIVLAASGWAKGLMPKTVKLGEPQLLQFSTLAEAQRQIPFRVDLPTALTDGLTLQGVAYSPDSGIAEVYYWNGRYGLVVTVTRFKMSPPPEALTKPIDVDGRRGELLMLDNSGVAQFFWQGILLTGPGDRVKELIESAAATR